MFPFRTVLQNVCIMLSLSVWWPAEAWSSPGRRRRLSSSNMAEQKGDTTSVGDYVQGVHGGKYQFSSAGINAAGMDFAASGYASTPIEEDHDDNEEMPRWAQRLGTNAEELEGRVIADLVVPAIVTVQNQERTWEPYYVKVMQIGVEGNTVLDVLEAGLFTATPSRGKLAPAGGAQNPYKPKEPYSDSASIQVAGGNTFGSYFLVVGTEEEQWIYRLRSPS